jgi:hypothetical protein
MKIKLFFLAIIFSTLANAQTPNWAWAHGAGGSSNHHYGTGICTDASGNSYVTGYFQNPFIVFGNDTLTGDASYHDNMFVVKYDDLGNVVWAKSAGGQNNCQGNKICCDANGNCYVTGTFHGTNTITFGSTTLTNNGVTNVFVVKYDNMGNAVWATTSAASTSWTDGTGISLDANGNVYVSGTFSDGNITFGSVTLTNTSFIFDDIFLVKYDNSGNVIWAKSAGGNSDDYVTGLRTDANGNSYLTGYSNSASMTFSSVTFPSTVSGYEIFVAEYDNAGNVIWAKGDGVTASLYKPAIDIDGSGNCYITGYFNGTSATFGTTTLTNAGINDIFIVKYNNAGNVVWAKRAGGTDFDEGHSISTDVNGNSYITGFFRGTITFGTFTFTTFTAAGGPDIFVAKYDSSGNVIWAKNVSYGINPDIGDGISISHGKAYVTGHFFSPTISFDTHAIVNVDNTIYPANVFVAKIDSSVVSGVNETSLAENQFDLFPNPSSGTFTIQMLNENTNGEIEIFNAVGEKILAFKNQPLNNFTIDLSTQPDGIYFVRVKTEKGFSTKKITIQH